MSGTENCLIRPMCSEDLEQVLSWRNHPEISRYMLTQHVISPDEHCDWFDRSSSDATQRLLIVEDNGLSLGFVHFSGVAHGGIADWGFYAAPGAPLGSGRKLGFSAMNFAFEKLGLHKVCGHVLSLNETSMRFHRVLGFQQEGVLRDQHRQGNTYRDLICFGLLKSEWVASEL